MKKILLILTIIIFLSCINLTYAAAKKTSKTKYTPTVSVSYYVKRKRALVVYFKNLNLAKSVSYTLSYKSSGVAKGVVGNLNIRKKYSLSRELLFGTCSSGICRYDKNITGCKLTVTSVLKKGNTVTKTYRIRV